MKITACSALVAAASLVVPITHGWTSSLTRRAKILHGIDKVLDHFQERKKHLAKHIYLNGNFAPVQDEHEGVPVQVVQGRLPKDLNGLFVRNGPNPIPNQMSKRYHWFDGHGMLHNLRFRNGKALYSNTYVPTPRYTIDKEFGEQYFNNIGEVKGVIGLIKVLWINVQKATALGLDRCTMGPANTHSVMYGNKFYCCQEASFPFEIVLNNNGGIDRAVGYETFDEQLNFPVSAHPRRDPHSGNLLFHGYTTDPKQIKSEAPIKIGEYSAQTKQVQSYVGVNPGDTYTSLAHDLMFTKDYTIVFDSSVHFDPKQIFSRDASFFRWMDDFYFRIGLVPRNEQVTAQDVQWFDTGRPQSLVHPLNAWQDTDGTVVLWAPVGDHFDGNLDSGSNFFYMVEYRMDPKVGTVTRTVIDAEHNTEYPRVRDDFVGKFGRYGYSGFIDPKGLGGEGLTKGFIVWDLLEKKVHKVVNFRPGDIGGETVVIPKAGRGECNAVYVGTFMNIANDNTSDFVLYDGETCSEEPVVRLRLPHRVPYGFHGQWLDETDLKAHMDFHAEQLRKERTF